MGIYLLHGIAGRRDRRERLEYGQRSIDQMIDRAEQNHVDLIAGQPPQPQQSLDPGDASPTDHYGETGHAREDTDATVDQAEASAGLTDAMG
jgi:hypothetical protein